MMEEHVERAAVNTLIDQHETFKVFRLTQAHQHQDRRVTILSVNHMLAAWLHTQQGAHLYINLKSCLDFLPQLCLTYIYAIFAFSALMLLARWQKEHLACNN